MDTARASGGGVVVPVKYTSVSGNAYFQVVASMSASYTSAYIAIFACNQTCHIDLETSNLLAMLQDGNSSAIHSTNPDVKILHVVSYGASLCISMFRAADITDPCTVSVLQVPGRIRFAKQSDVFRTNITTDTLLDIITKSYTSSLNTTIRMNGIDSTLMSISRLSADDIRGLQLNGTCIAVFGSADVSIRSMDKVGVSFVCDENDRGYALQYCVAPSMHLCPDMHYRPECQPPQPCVHGNYDPYVHECVCTEGYIGGDCSISACQPVCAYGTCREDNVCECTPPAYGPRCQYYQMNATNTSDITNMSIPDGAVIIIDTHGLTVTAVNGTLSISNGSNCMIVLSTNPRPGQRIVLFTYDRVAGHFGNVLVSLSNNNILDRCVGYNLEYGDHILSLVFYNKCETSDTATISWQVSVSIIAAVVSAIVIFILIARFNPRFRHWILPFRHSLDRRTSVPQKPAELRKGMSDQNLLDVHTSKSNELTADRRLLESPKPKPDEPALDSKQTDEPPWEKQSDAEADDEIEIEMADKVKTTK
jgi:hypothetical protein